MSDKYIGDFKKGQLVRVKFNTFSQALLPAAPSVALEVAIYKDSATEITTTGITQPTPNFDSKDGLHELMVDTSDTVYETGKDYDIVFTKGIVDGKDLTRTILRTFSIENRNIDANVIRIAGQAASADAPVSFPASVANESTVASRATQTSVNAIPTDPLLTTDTRLTNLDFPISSINTAISNINNLSALANLYAPIQLEIPDSGNIIYPFTIVVRDNEGKLVNLDSSPTLTAANASGTSRTSNLSSVTNPAIGRYTFTYTVASTHAKESIRIMASGAVSGEQRYVEWIGNVVDYDTLTTLQQVQTTVNSMDARLPASPAASVDIPAATAIRDVIMNSMPSGGWVDGSFGDRWVISNNDQRSIAITGSHHVAAVLHDAEPNSITEEAFTANAIARIQSGLALQSTILIVDKATRLIPALL
jgi:hypothetical protein